MSVVFTGCATQQISDADSKKKAREKFQEAREFQALNMTDEMMASYQEAITLDPKNLNYRLHLGHAYYVAKDYETAKSTYLEILKINKDFKPAYRELGRLAMSQRDWSQAIHYFTEDLNRPGTPMPHQIYNYLALSYYNLGKYQEAEQEWKKAIDIKDHAAIRLNLALAYRDRERYDDAINSLKKAIDLNPKFAQAHFELAVLFLREKENREASRHFNEVLRLAPQSQWAHSSRKYLNLMQ